MEEEELPTMVKGSSVPQRDNRERGRSLNGTVERSYSETDTHQDAHVKRLRMSQAQGSRSWREHGNEAEESGGEEGGEDGEAEEEDDDDEEDEDEDEDEEEKKSLQDFIVDEPLESEKEDDDDEDDDEADGGLPALDEDDLDLIAENMGLSVAPRIPPRGPEASTAPSSMGAGERDTEAPSAPFRRLKKLVRRGEVGDEEELAPESRDAGASEGRYHRVEPDQPLFRDDEEDDVDGDNVTSDVFHGDTRSSRDASARFSERGRLTDAGGEKVDDEDWGDEEEEEGDQNLFSMYPETAALISEVFGDMGAVMEILGKRRPQREESRAEALAGGALEDEDEMEGMEDAEAGQAGTTCQSLTVDVESGPQLLAEAQDPEAAAICLANMPERHYMAYGARWPKRSQSELEREAAWIAWRVTGDLQLHAVDLDPKTLQARYAAAFGANSTYYDPETTSVEKDIAEKTVLFLDFLLNQRLEVPTILSLYGHLLCPPLEERLCWLIVDLNDEWSRLAASARYAHQILSKAKETSSDLSATGIERSAFERMEKKLLFFRIEEEIEDVKSYVHFFYPELAQTAVSGLNRRKRQAAASSGTESLLRLTQKSGLSAHWSAYLLSGDQFGANLSKSEALGRLIVAPEVQPGTDVYVEHPPPADPPLPGRGAEAVEAWLGALRQGPFSSSDRILEALVTLESAKLAAHVEVRDTLRRWFLRAARVSTVLTKKGISVCHPSKRNWAALHLRRKPVSDLLQGGPVRRVWGCGVGSVDDEDEEGSLGPVYFGFCENRRRSRGDLRRRWEDAERASRETTAFLEILKAEAEGLVTVVIHPVIPGDIVPWRRAGRGDGVPRGRPGASRVAGAAPSGGVEDASSGSLGMVSTALAETLPSVILRQTDHFDTADEAVLNNLLSSLSGLYTSGTHSTWAVEVQNRVLQRLLYRELVPLFRRELRYRLQRQAEAVVAALCYDALKLRLNQLPYAREPQRGCGALQRATSQNASGSGRSSSSDDEDHSSSDSDTSDSETGSHEGSEETHRNEANDDEDAGAGTHGDDRGWKQKRPRRRSTIPPRVVALVIQRMTGTGIRVHALSVDRTGLPVSYETFNALLADERGMTRGGRMSVASSGAGRSQDLKGQAADMALLRKFLSAAVPDVVAIGASDRLAQALATIVHDLRRDTEKRKKRNGRKKLYQHAFNVVFGSLEVPRIYAGSSLCPGEYKKSFRTFGCQALGLAHCLQEPLGSHLQLWEGGYSGSPNLLLHLKYHPLQGLVPKDRLERVLLQAAVTCVAAVGVDINVCRSASGPHLHAALKFVPGLGPRKAASLLWRLTAPVLSRAQLESVLSHVQLEEEEPTQENRRNDGESRKEEETHGSRKTSTALPSERTPLNAATENIVFFNCASFIRISRKLCLEYDSPDPLACTRTHPVLSYATAQKIARDALEDRRPASNNVCVALMMRSPRWLEYLDLEAYAGILKENGQLRMLPYLETIKRELKNPYADPRLPFEAPTGKRLFYLMLDEDPEEFTTGSEVTATVAEARNSYVRLSLQPSNIDGDVADLPSYLAQVAGSAKTRHSTGGGGLLHSMNGGAVGNRVETLLPVKSIISCRIRNINPEEFSATVVLSNASIIALLVDTISRRNTGLAHTKYNIATSRELLEHFICPSAGNTTRRSENEWEHDNRAGSGVSAPSLQPGSHTLSPMRRTRDSARASIGSGARFGSERPSESLGGGGGGGIPKRRIAHPRFRFLPPSKVVRELRNARVGDALFTPNEGSLSELVLTIKTCDKPFMTKSIVVEELDQRVPGELGRTLRIGRETFMDLDQILGQYVERLRINLNEVFGFEKYCVADSVEVVEKRLIDAQKAKAASGGPNASGSIEWGITIDPTYPSHAAGVRFHLLALPPNTAAAEGVRTAQSSDAAGEHGPLVLKDGLYVTPTIFKLWTRKERSLRRLTNWWKMEGYFQRKRLLAEYNAMRKQQHLQQQQNPDPIARSQGGRSFPEPAFLGAAPHGNGNEAAAYMGSRGSHNFNIHSSGGSHTSRSHGTTPGASDYESSLRSGMRGAERSRTMDSRDGRTSSSFSSSTHYSSSTRRQSAPTAQNDASHRRFSSYPTAMAYPSVVSSSSLQGPSSTSNTFQHPYGSGAPHYHETSPATSFTANAGVPSAPLHPHHSPLHRQFQRSAPTSEHVMYNR